MHLVQTTPFKGADVIERKTRRLIARRLLGHEKRRGNVVRHEWLDLVHDDIGTFEVAIFSRWTRFKS